jgi:hypothetical protein
MSGEKLKRMAVIELARKWGGAMKAAVVATPKQRIDIEALLAWAYLRELPKVPRIPAAPEEWRRAWDKVSQMGEELSLAGLDDNRFGVVPDLFAQDLPHNDALLVHDAVCALDAFCLNLPEDWSPLDDLGDLGGHAGEVAAKALERLTSIDDKGQRHLRRTPRRLLMRHAILGSAPDWEIEPPDVRFVQEFGADKWFVREVIVTDGAFGPSRFEVEVDGFDHVRRMPKPFAYRKTELVPDPTDGCVARAEYEVWRYALDALAADLDGRLERFDVVPSVRPMRPWEEPAPQMGRVLPDLTRRAAHDSGRVRGRRKKITSAA